MSLTLRKPVLYFYILSRYYSCFFCFWSPISVIINNRLWKHRLQKRLFCTFQLLGIAVKLWISVSLSLPATCFKNWKVQIDFMTIAQKTSHLYLSYRGTILIPIHNGRNITLNSLNLIGIVELFIENFLTSWSNISHLIYINQSISP